MVEPFPIAISQLHLDPENPRLSTPNSGQRETLREMAKLQGTKLRFIAEDILDYGLNPSELPIVTPVEDRADRFVVLDGNRRVTAIKVLENPELVQGAIDQPLLKAMRLLSQKYHTNPIEEIPCVSLPNRAEADHWIELRHTGERQGAGAVQWGSQESARFRARNKGERDIHIQALDFLENRGDLTLDRRNLVAATTLKRLLATRYVRERLGIEWSEKTLTALADEGAIARALLYVANDIADKNVKVSDVYKVKQRMKYADELPNSVMVRITREAGTGVPLGERQNPKDPGTETKKTGGTRRPRKRERLIPSDCTLNVTDPRIREIEYELRHLSLETCPNAVSVLTRVFLELSTDWYIDSQGLTVQKTTSLGSKLKVVADDLVHRRKLTEDQAKPARRAAQRNTFLGPSITQMHQWIHNRHMFPGPADLRAEWDGLQPWFTAVWATP